MNIVIVNNSFGLGGVERVSTTIGKELRKYHNVYFYSILYSNNYFEIENKFINGAFTKKKDHFIRVFNKSLKLCESVLRNGKVNQPKYFKVYLKKLIQFIKEKNIEVVILNGPILIGSIEFLKKSLDCKFIAWIHNNYDTYLNEYTKGYQKQFVKSLSIADKVVCLTQYDLIRYSKINSETVCIYNPLTINNKEVSTLKNRKIAFTGRIDFNHKGIDYLLNIAELLPASWTIDIAGDGENSQVKKFKKIIYDKKLEKRINYKGPLKGDRLLKHYSEASIYLMTSRWEGMPLVLAEAMSFGLPIIAFEQTGSSEVLQQGKYGILVESGNVAEMAEQLIKLIENFSTRAYYQELSLQRVKAFNISYVRDSWLNLIESMKETTYEKGID